MVSRFINDLKILNSIFLIFLILLPLPSLALNRSVICLDKNLHYFKSCKTQAKLIAVKKRNRYVEKCRKKIFADIKLCIAKVKREKLFEDCNSLPTPYPIGPVIKQPNPKYIACFHHYTEQLQKFSTNMHKGNRAKRADKLRKFLSVETPKMVHCALENEPNSRLYSPPLTRPAFSEKPVWTYPIPQRVGTRGYLCLGPHSGVRMQWVPAVLRKVNGNNITVKYRRGTKVVTWARFIPGNGAKLRNPTTEQINEKAAKDQFGKFLVEYVRAYAKAKRDNKPFTFKPEHVSSISVIHASFKHLSFKLDLKQWKAGKGVIYISTYIKKFANHIFYKNADKEGLFAYYPESIGCKTKGNLNKAYLPEICQ